MLGVCNGSNPFVRGHNNNRHLSPDEMDNNIGGLPVTDCRLRELFNSLDVDGSGFLEKQEVRKMYSQFDNFGVDYSDREIEQQINKYAIRDDGKVDFDEFCCIILSVAQR
ncbi:Calmodulin [Diplonema papillatum]|nr:Calmodulin [Diplonema papillatum]